MRVFITGGAGFIGSHLTARLVRDGADVVVLDDLSTGHAEGLAEGARLERGDVRDPDAVARCVEGADLVVHLAAAVGPRMVAEDPVGTWSRNVEGTACVVRACAEQGTRLLFTSSSEVYGERADARPMHEDDLVHLDPVGRRDVYALSKLAGESLALAEHRSRLLPATVVRLFNVVGPGQGDRYGMVLPRFAAAALRGEPLPVYGDGTARRCFLHVADAVEGLLALARTPAAEGCIINLGSDEELSISALAERVLAANGGGGSVRHIPFERVYGEGFRDPPRRRPDVARIHALTGWRPERTMDDAIRDVLLQVARVAAK